MKKSTAVIKVSPKPTTGKPAPKFTAKKKPRAAASRSVPCPSCKATVMLDAHGAPISHDVAHFTTQGKPAVAPAKPDEPVTPATPATPEPTRDSLFGRIDRNLTDMLED